MDGPTWYEIHVKSYLDESLAPTFAGMAIHHDAPDETILCGPLVDQAALHGVLMRIRDLGLSLLAVRACPEPDEGRIAAPQQEESRR